MRSILKRLQSAWTGVCLFWRNSEKLSPIVSRTRHSSSGVETGWTVVDMSTPVSADFDFLIYQKPFKKLWGGGVDFHSIRTFIHSSISLIHSLIYSKFVKIIATLTVTVASCKRTHHNVKIINTNLLACLLYCQTRPTLGTSH